MTAQHQSLKRKELLLFPQIQTQGLSLPRNHFIGIRGCYRTETALIPIMDIHVGHRLVDLLSLTIYQDK